MEYGPDRRDVEFTSGGEVCAAWLYTPAGAGPHPIVVMAHGLGSVKEMRLDAFAERFQAAGYACLVFDYRYWGGQFRRTAPTAHDPASTRRLARCRGLRALTWGNRPGPRHGVGHVV